MSDKEKPVKETGKAKRAGKPSNGLVKTNKERWDSKPSIECIVNHKVSIL